MREILFRAQILGSMKWVTGYFAVIGKRRVIIAYPPESYFVSDNMEIGNGNKIVDVDPSTICQYTGLTDKNGKRIWEYDIVSFWDTYSTENGQAEIDCVGRVIWDKETLSFLVTNRMSAESHEILHDCVVIGNVFDNPELL